MPSLDDIKDQLDYTLIKEGTFGHQTTDQDTYVFDLVGAGGASVTCQGSHNDGTYSYYVGVSINNVTSPEGKVWEKAWKLAEPNVRIRVNHKTNAIAIMSSPI